MRVARLGMAGLWLVGAGCTTEEVTPLFEVVPESLVLPPVAWTDSSTEWSVISVLNATYFTLTISDIRVNGDAADFIEVERLTELAREMPIRSAVRIPIRVTPPDSEQLATWDEAVYSGVLEFSIGGAGELDPATGLPDLDSWVTATVEIPIWMSTRCDLDGDGYEDRSCGGDDCSDSLASVNIAAIEGCDGFDNNCNGVRDEGCSDL